MCRYPQSESDTIRNVLLTQTEIFQTLFCANEISGTVAVYKLILINKSFSDNSLNIHCIKVSNFFKKLKTGMLSKMKLGGGNISKLSCNESTD